MLWRKLIISPTVEGCSILKPLASLCNRNGRNSRRNQRKRLSLCLYYFDVKTDEMCSFQSLIRSPTKIPFKKQADCVSCLSESLRGARVLVTGASTGIGEQLAYHYARFGAQIVITARREKVLHQVGFFLYCFLFLFLATLSLSG